MPSQNAQPLLRPRLFTTSEAAQYLNVSPRTVGRLVATGELRVIRYFKYHRFDCSDLDEFVERIK
jgi:excisionase family DNA binding protein